jgi:hypothetical protein
VRAVFSRSTMPKKLNNSQKIFFIAGEQQDVKLDFHA